jgi:hypothetical protein
MPGLWERIHPDAVDRLAVHLLDAAMVLYATGTYTRQQIVNALNAHLQTPLTSTELTDLSAIADTLDAQGTANAKVVYEQQVMGFSIAGEFGVIDEAQFRAGLGLP